MKKTIVLLSCLAAAACASHRDVRPGADGVHRVQIQTDDVDSGSRKAIKEANNYCKEKGKEPGFLGEKSNYTGDMDESDYKTGKRVAKVVETVGGAVWVFGGPTERSIGGLAGIGGFAADQALGNGYTVEMRFRCM